MTMNYFKERRIQKCGADISDQRGPRWERPFRREVNDPREVPIVNHRSRLDPESAAARHVYLDVRNDDVGVSHEHVLTFSQVKDF